MKLEGIKVLKISYYFTRIVKNREEAERACRASEKLIALNGNFARYREECFSRISLDYFNKGMWADAIIQREIIPHLAKIGRTVGDKAELYDIEGAQLIADVAINAGMNILVKKY